jgi:hypothetical protein
MRRLLVPLILAGSPAYAEDPPVTSAGPASAQHPEGEYGGVQPGQGKKPETGKKAKKPPPKGTLSWIGFEVKGGGSDVFLQSPAPFEITQQVDKGAVVVTLTGVSRLGANTWRPIDTRFFDTTLSRISARKKGKSIEVRIAFKNAKDAAHGSVRTATDADGLYYGHLGFTGGSPAPASTAPTTSEPEKK